MASLTSAESPVRRCRKKNWGPTEVEILISEVGQRFYILFSWKSTFVCNAMKKRAWEEITAKINSNSSVKRHIGEVKKKWRDLKSIARKKAATVNRERCKTEGGLPSTELNVVEQKIVSLISHCHIEGCKGGLENEVVECLPQMTASVPDGPDGNASAMPSETESVEPASATVNTEKEKENVVPSSDFCNSKEKPSKGSCDRITGTKEMKLKVMERLLIQLTSTQKELLNIEKRRLEIEEEKLKMLKNGLDVSVLY